VTPAATRRLAMLLAWSAGAAALLVILTALAGGDSAVRARKVLTFAVVAEALAAVLAPLFAAGPAARGRFWAAAGAVAMPVAWVFLGSAPGELVLALGLDRGALGALLLAKLVAASAGLAAAGLVLALARLTGRPPAAAALAGFLLLAFVLLPMYSLTAIRALSADGRTAARDRLISAGLRSPPLAAAYTLAGSARPAGWGYQPHTSPWFYHHWVGTDYPLAPPSPGEHLAGYLLAAVLLAGAGALRRGAGRADLGPNRQDAGNGA